MGDHSALPIFRHCSDAVKENPQFACRAPTGAGSKSKRFAVKLPAVPTDRALPPLRPLSLRRIEDTMRLRPAESIPFAERFARTLSN